tara:strand:- start:6333 stop:6890 length:558 start_codon:yes stop_codon:yes gene_type:complete
MQLRKINQLTLIIWMACLLATPLLAQEQPWLHVQVEEDATDGKGMDLRLPLPAVVALITMVPNTTITNGQLELNREQQEIVTVLRDLLKQLERAEGSQFLASRHENGTVRVERQGQHYKVDIHGQGISAHATVSVVLVQALLSGETETLNIDEGVKVLRELRGEVIRVDESNRHIRVRIGESTDQ